METIKEVKKILEKNLTKTDLLTENLPRGFRVLAMSIFWDKCNFSGIIRFRRQKFYAFFDNTLQKICVQYAR
jgi:predicted metal-dependent hydrolase